MPGDRKATVHADFGSDLKFGQNYERHIAELVGGTMGASTRDSGDITVTTSIGATDCEIKFDERYDTTGNIALEVADVFSDKMLGTGVGKQCGIGIPSLNVHALGSTGNFLVYHPIDVFEYEESEGLQGFDRLVSVQNRKWSTVNLIVKPSRLTKAKVAVELHEDELDDFLRSAKPAIYNKVVYSEVKNAYTNIIRSAGYMDDPRYYHRNFVLKCSKPSVDIDPLHLNVDHDKVVLPKRGSLVPLSA